MPKHLQSAALALALSTEACAPRQDLPQMPRAEALPADVQVVQGTAFAQLVQRGLIADLANPDATFTDLGGSAPGYAHQWGKDGSIGAESVDHGERIEMGVTEADDGQTWRYQIPILAGKDDSGRGERSLAVGLDGDDVTLVTSMRVLRGPLSENSQFNSEEFRFSNGGRIDQAVAAHGDVLVLDSAQRLFYSAENSLWTALDWPDGVRPEHTSNSLDIRLHDERGGITLDKLNGSLGDIVSSWKLNEDREWVPAPADWTHEVKEEGLNCHQVTELSGHTHTQCDSRFSIRNQGSEVDTFVSALPIFDAGMNGSLIVTASHEECLGFQPKTDGTFSRIKMKDCASLVPVANQGWLEQEFIGEGGGHTTHFVPLAGN